MSRYGSFVNECEKCGGMMTREIKWTTSGAAIYVDTCVRCKHITYPKASDVPGSWRITFEGGNEHA